MCVRGAADVTHTSREPHADVACRYEMTRMDTSADAQLSLLAGLVLGALVLCIAAIVALAKSGRTVPPAGAVLRRRLPR